MGAGKHASMCVCCLQVNSEFQAFKHIEMVAPGELMKASEPLEATLAVHPTLVLTNALPYSIEITVWMVRRSSCHTLLHLSSNPGGRAFISLVVAGAQLMVGSRRTQSCDVS